MAKFRKIPVVIEAVQLLDSYASIVEVENFLGNQSFKLPVSIQEHDRLDEYSAFLHRQGGRRLKTMESHNETQIAKFTDWIIKGVQGEFYPCDNEVFQKTYERVLPHQEKAQKNSCKESYPIG